MRFVQVLWRLDAEVLRDKKFEQSFARFRFEFQIFLLRPLGSRTYDEVQYCT